MCNFTRVFALKRALGTPDPPRHEARKTRTLKRIGRYRTGSEGLSKHEDGLFGLTCKSAFSERLNCHDSFFVVVGLVLFLFCFESITNQTLGKTLRALKLHYFLKKMKPKQKKVKEF